MSDPKPCATRMPEFDPADPEMWFRRVEGIFARNKIEDAVMQYHDVVAALPGRYAKEVRDVIMEQTTTTSYTNLKQQLIKRIGCTQEEKTRQLLESESIGDDKPSQFWRRLLTLAGNDLTESVIRGLWIRRLPQSLQPIMATQKDVAISTAVELADSIFELMPSRLSISETTTQGQGYNEVNTLLQKLVLKCDAIQNRIAALENGEVFQLERMGRSRRRSASRSTARSDICYYHRRYKSKARRCNSPCTWNQGNAIGDR